MFNGKSKERCDTVLVVVLGAAGFVGRNVVERLLAEGHDVIACDIVEDPFRGGVSYVKVDILDEAGIAQVVEGADTLVHLAAHPLSASIERPKLNAMINVQGSLNAFDAARAAGVRKVLFASASSLVGGVLYSPVDETHPATPETPYGVAKLAAEHYLRVYRELYGLHYLVFRFFNVYGPWQLPDSGALIPTMYERLSEGQPITVWGDGSSVRDYVYVGDVADLFAEGVVGPVQDEVVNVGTGRGTTVLDIARLGGKILEVEPQFDFQPPRAGEIANFTADTRKLARLFGKVPSTILEEGLTRTFRWLKDRA